MTTFARIRCKDCGVVDLSEEEYERQMNKPDDHWMCPRCTGIADFDDKYFEDTNISEVSARAQQEAEPVEWQVRNRSSDGRWMGWGQVRSEDEAKELVRRYKEIAQDAEYRALYVAPQPRIDLSQFKEAVMCWKADLLSKAKAHAAHWGSPPEPWRVESIRIAEADRLLALIAEQEKDSG